MTTSTARRSEWASILGGGALLMVAMLAVSAGNYGLNIGLGRWLTPAEFGDVALMVTIMLMTTVLTSSLQVATATVVARSPRGGADAAVARVRRTATRAGAGLALLGAATAIPLAATLRVDDPITLVVMAVGLPLHLRLGVDRGRIQGELDLGRLAATFGAELAGRVALTVGLVAAGFGAVGATIGLNVGFATALLVVDRRPTVRDPIPAGQRAELVAACRRIGVLMVATTIINNGDVVVSKALLDPTDAGRYAAIALVGRAVFFVAWSLQQAAVPLVARAAGGPGSERAAARASIALTAVLAGSLAAIAWYFDDVLVDLAFGSEYAALAGLLGPYALATACFAVANTIATVDAASDSGVTSLALLGGALVQTVAVATAGATATAIVSAQVWSMVALLGLVGVLHVLRPHLKSARLPVDPIPEGIAA